MQKESAASMCRPIIYVLWTTHTTTTSNALMHIGERVPVGRTSVREKILRQPQGIQI